VKIAMVGLRGVPANHGGVERHVEELGAVLVERGHEVTVYCRAPYFPLRPAEHRGMHLAYLPSPTARAVESAVHSPLAALAALRMDYDVVHYHALGPTLFSPITRLSRRTAVVATVQGLDYQRDKWGPVARAVLRGGERASVRIPDEVITVSHALREHYLQHLGRPATAIPNGVSSALQHIDGAAQVRAVGLEPGGYVLQAGRLVPEKRTDLLLAAYAGLRTDLPLVIAGGSSHTTSYVDKVHRVAAADPRVCLLGAVPTETVAALCRHAAVTVHPSALEGLPLTLLEALATGAPVVASDIAPHVEVLGRSGPGHRLFRTDDQAALAAALGEALLDPAGERRAAAPLQRQVLTRYSWPVVAAATEAVYERAVARRGSRLAPRRLATR